MQPMIVLTILLCSLILGMLLTILSIKIGYYFKIIDFPNQRKVHRSPIPRTGGIGVFGSFFIIVLFILLFTNLNKNLEMIFFLLSGLLIFLLGLLDDKYNLSAKKK